MKQGSFRAVRLVVLTLLMLTITGFSAIGDENTINYESIVLEKFSGELEHKWSYGDRDYQYNFDWSVDASKFASVVKNEQFPKLAKVEAWPIALHGVNKSGQELTSLGLWGKFDRRGYNWVDLYPSVPGTGQNGEDPEPFEIPMPGRLQYMDMWVWGSNLNYYIEAYFRDYQGIVHSLYMGDLRFQGWKNLRVKIPNSIPQSKRILPRYAGLTFVKFRVWTTPMERVDNFYIYFNEIKVLTDVFESNFDGDDLADPENVQQIWAQR